MLASRKAEISFAYSRREDGTFKGLVLIDDGSADTRPDPVRVTLPQPMWVRFVIETIRQHPGIGNVVFRFEKPEGPYYHALDRRTLKRICDARQPIDDFIL